MIVTEAAWPYLVLQQGALYELRHERAAWKAAYDQALRDTFYSISPHLPRRLTSVLDVGGGMGGIDALINERHGHALEVCILDGESDPPQLKAHAVPFNDKEVCFDFLAQNGVAHRQYVTPDLRTGPGFGERPFDLVLSFASWCFHYPPETYLDFVRRVTGPGSVLILDVRRGRPDWVATLEQAFGTPDFAHRSIKFDRLAFTVA